MMAMALGHILAEVHNGGACFWRAGEITQHHVALLALEREMQAICSYILSLSIHL